MTSLAVELNDRALSIARQGVVLQSRPAAVFDGGSNEPAGRNAWGALRARPTSVSTRHFNELLNSRADKAAALASISLVGAELSQRLSQLALLANERIWIATPARSEAAGLEAMLQIAHRLHLPVDGFVDCAAVTVAALGLHGAVIVLEAGLHHVAATAIEASAEQIRRRGSSISDHGGYLELHQAWLDLISSTMVKRLRFDPLHDAAIEQSLFDTLPVLIDDLQTSGTVAVTATQGAESFEVTLTRDQFALAAEPFHRSLRSLIHQLRPAGSPLTIVLPQRVACLPGLREELEQFTGCELVSVVDGFAAAATSLLELPASASPDSVPLVRRLPAQRREALLSGVTTEALGVRRVAPPSHVLFDGRAYVLSADKLVVGRGAGTGSGRQIQLPEGHAGVSRRHCTLIHDGGEYVLLDHSSHGTFVNDERVNERVRIHAGDRIRVGDPGLTLELIAVGGHLESAGP